MLREVVVVLLVVEAGVAGSAVMGAIGILGPAPLKTMAESVATLARCRRGTASSAEKEQLEELGRAGSTPDSRFRTAARSSARSEMDGAEESVGQVASRRALRRDAVTGGEVERGRLAYTTVGGGTA